VAGAIFFERNRHVQVTRRPEEVDDRLNPIPKVTEVTALVPVPDPARGTVVQEPLGNGPLRINQVKDQIVRWVPDRR